MAMIQKIRNQSGLLIGIIGVAMILFLLGGDFLTSGGGSFGNSETNILEVNGKAVSYAEFENRVQEQITRNYGANPVSDQAKQQIRSQVWNILLNEKIMSEEYNELGLSVTPDEIFDQIKTNPSPLLAQYFTDPQTGRIYEQFANPVGGLDGEKVIFAIKQMLNDPKGEASWLAIEQSLKTDRYTTKYYNLIKKGLNVTSKQAEVDLQEKGKRLSFRYVLKEYAEIDDNSVTVTDADLKKYYNEHKHEPFYIQKEASIAVEYVIFQAEPSAEDIAAIQEEMEMLKTRFQNETEDTLFVNENADTPYNVRYYSKGSFPEPADSVLFTAEQGTVVGPYLDNATYYLAKVLGSKTSPDSVEARHILLKINNGDTAKTMALADSLKNVIKAQNNFDVMAREFSEDFGSAQDGGNLGWFTEGTMVKPFNDACFEGKVGDMPIVTSQFGVHLIEILDQTEPKDKKLIALVDRKLEPGKATYDRIYNEASKFSIENNTAAAFRTAGNEKGIRVADFIRETDKDIAGLEGSRDLIRWGFGAEAGEVSQPFEFGDKFVVAHLKEKREKGLLTLDNESVKEKVRQGVLIEKKAEMIQEELSKFSTLEEAASALGKTIETSANVTFNIYSVPGVGSERMLLGALFSLPQGQLSKPIKDKRGVYLVVVDQITEAPEGGNVLANKSQLNRNLSARVDYEVFKALESGSEIVDNRGKFY